MHSRPQGTRRFDLDALLETMARLEDPTRAVTLHVADGRRERIAFFVPGGVRLLARGEGADHGLLRELLARCLVDLESLQELSGEASSGGAGLADLVVQRELVARDELVPVVSKVVRDEMLGLVFWQGALCVVHEDSPPRELYGSVKDLFVAKVDTQELARDVTRWIQMWSRAKSVLISERARVVPAASARAGAVELDPELSECLEACAGGPELGRLWQESRIDLPLLAARVLELERRGLVAIEAPSSSGSDVVRELREEIEAIERNLSRFVGQDLAREKLVECYRKAGQTHKAVYELRTLAERSLERGDWAGAADRLKEVLQLERENLEAHERLFRIYVEHGQVKRAVSGALSQAREFIAKKSWEEARFLARLLCSVEDGRIGGAVVEADSLAANGQEEGAVERYLQAAEDALSADRPAEAIQVLEHAEARTRGDPRVTARLAQLRAAGRAARVRTRRDSEAAEPEPEAVRNGAWLGRRTLVRAAAALAGSLLLAAVLFLLRAIPRGEPTAAAVDDPAAGHATAPGAEHSGPAKGKLYRRLVADRLEAVYGASLPLELIDRWSGRRIAGVDGRPGCRWAVDRGARRVCRWKAGERPWVQALPGGAGRELEWSLPGDVEAMAIGGELLAMRRGGHTVLADLETGTDLGRAELPYWIEGVFIGELLVVQEAPYAGGAIDIHGVRASDLELVWSSTVEDGAFMFR